jgi:hypothetical protein
MTKKINDIPTSTILLFWKHMMKRHSREWEPPNSKKKAKAKNSTSAKKVGKARSKLRMHENEAARRETGGTVSTSGRVVVRDDGAGLVVERKRGKNFRIVFPVRSE